MGVRLEHRWSACRTHAKEVNIHLEHTKVLSWSDLNPKRMYWQFYIVHQLYAKNWLNQNCSIKSSFFGRKKSFKWIKFDSINVWLNRGIGAYEAYLRLQGNKTETIVEHLQWGSFARGASGICQERSFWYQQITCDKSTRSQKWSWRIVIRKTLLFLLWIRSIKQMLKRVFEALLTHFWSVIGAQLERN